MMLTDQLIENEIKLAKEFSKLWLPKLNDDPYFFDAPIQMAMAFKEVFEMTFDINNYRHTNAADQAYLLAKANEFYKDYIL